MTGSEEKRDRDLKRERVHTCAKVCEEENSCGGYSETMDFYQISICVVTLHTVNN